MGAKHYTHNTGAERDAHLKMALGETVNQLWQDEDGWHITVLYYGRRAGE